MGGDLRMVEVGELEAHALDLHRKSLVVDVHCDSFGAFAPWEMRTYRDAAAFSLIEKVGLNIKRSFGERSDIGQVDLPRLIEGGVDCQFFTVPTEYTIPSLEPLQALQRLDFIYSEVEKNRNKIAVATTYDDVINNNEEGKISAVLYFEGGYALRGNLRVLRMMYRLGIRAMGLVWFYRNELADSSREKRAMGGLSDFGVSVVEEMNRLGMIVDVSHLNDPGFWDVIEVSKDPVINTHACCRELCNVPRNLTDEMIKALAEKGGIIGVDFVPAHLSPDKRATVETVVNHIEHVVDLVGIDHVGLGSDFDGGGTALKDATEMPNITKELVKRGYSDSEVKKIIGGNFLRIFKQIWKTK